MKTLEYFNIIYTKILERLLDNTQIKILHVYCHSILRERYLDFRVKE